MPFKGLSLFSVFVLIFIISDLKGQGLSNHQWHFGNSPEWVRFSRSDTLAELQINQAIPFGMGGSATATHPVSGDLLFYSDGVNVYDATNLIMLNGGGLSGLNT